VLEAFVSATRRAARAGFDSCEMHGAHGYLLSSFFSPLANRREDEYGGSIENRMRFPLQVFRAMREAWPADKPLGVLSLNSILMLLQRPLRTSVLSVPERKEKLLAFPSITRDLDSIV